MVATITMFIIIISIDGGRKYRHFLVLHLPCNLSTDFVYLFGNHVLIILIENCSLNGSPLFLNNKGMAFAYLIECRYGPGVSETRVMMLVT